ncbi:MAG: GAF domain-containing protein, partial [Brevinematales bacterium]
MKKVFDFLLSLLVVFLVALWVYRLSLVYQGLPQNDTMAYVHFIVELWLFTFFLVASGIVVLWVWVFEKSSRNVSSDLAKEIKRLSLLLDRKDFQIQNPHTDDQEVRRLELFLRPLRAVTATEWATSAIEGCFVLCGARRVSLFVKRGDDLVLVKSMGLPDAKVGQRLSFDDLAFRMFQKQKRLFVTEIETHPEIARPNKLGYASHSFLIVPIVTYQHEALGVINLTEKENAAIFTSTELEMVCQFVTIAA